MPAQRKILIADYYNEQIADICFYMECIPGKHKKKDIHQLRVRIKRLKALFRLLQYMYPSGFSAKEHYGLFRPVFKSAGMVREIQLNRILLNEFSGAEELQKGYNDYIEMLLQVMTGDLDMALRRFDYARLHTISSRVGDLFEEHGEAALLDLITGFIRYETGRIRCLTDDLAKTEYIHDIRIMLKNIKPLLLLVYPVTYSVFSEAHYRQLNDTETSIGKWHDLQVLSVSLSLFLSAVEKRNSGISKEYETLYKKLETKKRRALVRAKKSIAETSSFFNEGP